MTKRTSIHALQILLVEEREEEVEEIKYELDKLELYYELSWARNAVEAIELLKDRSLRNILPDIVLIDSNLPDSSGLELVIEIRREKNWRQFSCFLLVPPGHSVPNGSPELPGLSGYINKPFSLSGATSSGKLHLMMDLMNRNEYRRL
jgi:DNA-binding response OmpR family regulator